ncbi:MAG: hypothetical protein CL931_10935 [Deltaproteobacteria bacterium]|nr:hypothetical protein [Deltaproteobacteria bacterium]
MNLEQGNESQFIDPLGFLRRQGKFVAMISGGIILLTFWITMALPNLYTSAAMILVEPQSVDEELVNSGVRESDLNERLGLMTTEILSRVRLSKIIDDMDLYAEESEDMQRIEVVDFMRSFINVVPVLSELEEGQRRREIKFNTFRIIFRHEDRQVAADVAQRIANDFINANIESRTQVTSKSLDFMQDEIAVLTRNLAEVEGEIAKIKAESAGKLPDEFDANQRMLQYAMGDLRDAQRVFASAESDAAYWKNQVLTASQMTSGDPSSPSYRRGLLEIELSSLRARGYTARHPDVLRVEAEISLLTSQLNAQAAALQQGDGRARSMGEQNARSEQGRAELKAAAAAEDIERLRERIADLEARLAATPAVAEKLDGLNRRYEGLSRSYQDFSSRLQQASVQADLERRQLGERFRILESAEPAPEPSSPNRFLILVLGSILGLGIAASVGLVAEVADSSVHTTNELQQSLGIPVLVSVPRIMLESDRAARSRRILRETMAAIAVVLFVLIGGGVTYYFVNMAGKAGLEETEIEGTTEEARSGDLGEFGLG